MNIALIAHDSKKELMVQFCTAYFGILSKHNLCATGLTGHVVSETTKLKIERVMNGNQGGIEQITAKISCGEIDILFFFRDPVSDESSRPDDMRLLIECDMDRIPLATNIATAEALIHALERGDFEWLEIERERGKKIDLK